MATTQVTLTSSWQLIASDGFEFIVDNSSSYPAQITFQTSAPAGNAAYHTLQPGEGLTRMGLTGNVYARDDASTGGAAFVVVTA